MKNKLLKTIATTFLTGAMLVSAFAPGMTVKAAETTDRTPIYRLYNPDNGEHLYTTDVNERDVLYSSYGWGYEGIAWYASTSGTPVYRLYNNVLCNHLYTTDLNEIKVLTSMPDTAWTVDNNNQPLFYSDGEVPIYRVYNEGLQGMHHLTTDKNEYDTLPQFGWAQEGVSLYAISIGMPINTMYSSTDKPVDNSTENPSGETTKFSNLCPYPLWTWVDFGDGVIGMYEPSTEDYETYINHCMERNDYVNNNGYKPLSIEYVGEYEDTYKVDLCKYKKN